MLPLPLPLYDRPAVRPDPRRAPAYRRALRLPRTAETTIATTTTAITARMMPKTMASPSFPKVRKIPPKQPPVGASLGA